MRTAILYELSFITVMEMILGLILGIALTAAVLFAFYSGASSSIIFSFDFYKNRMLLAAMLIGFLVIYPLCRFYDT